MRGTHPKRDLRAARLQVCLSGEQPDTNLTLASLRRLCVCLDSMVEDSQDLSLLQRIYFWSGAILPSASIVLYTFFPEGTIEHFGGTVTPTATFWCTIAASGDAMYATLCGLVLMHPRDLLLGRSVLLTNAIYSIFHFGNFLRAHYTIEPHPSGPGLYYFGIIASWLAYFVWGFPRGSASEDIGESIPTYRYHT